MEGIKPVTNGRAFSAVNRKKGILDTGVVHKINMTTMTVYEMTSVNTNLCDDMIDADRPGE